MRSVWSTLVAVALVVAGARVGAAPTGHAGHSELHAAKSLRIAPTVRRAHTSARPLGALLGVATIELPAVTRHVLPSGHRAVVSQSGVQPLFVRSSRGPPRA